MMGRGIDFTQLLNALRSRMGGAGGAGGASALEPILDGVRGADGGWGVPPAPSGMPGMMTAGAGGAAAGGLTYEALMQLLGGQQQEEQGEQAPDAEGTAEAPPAGAGGQRIPGFRSAGLSPEDDAALQDYLMRMKR